jgi:hypothetical protein
MESPIETVPMEILEKMFEHVAQALTCNLTNSLSTCKTWYHQAQLVLYSDIVLGTSQLTKFVSHDTFSSDCFVHTLSILLKAPDPDQDEERLWRVASLGAHKLWADLDKLAHRVKNMSNLYSFSFSCAYKEFISNWNYFWIPRIAIAKILDQICPKCIGLEIDTGKNMPDVKNSSHICHSIRRLVPQLKYLRLKLPIICPEMFPEPFDDGLTASKIEQLIIRTDMTGSYHSILCGPHTDTYEDGYYPKAPSASGAISNCLRRLWEHGYLPNIKICYVIDAQRSGGTDNIDNFHPNVYSAFFRRDIIGNRSCPLPYRVYGMTGTPTAFLLCTEHADLVGK